MLGKQAQKREFGILYRKLGNCLYLRWCYTEILLWRMQHENRKSRKS